MAIPEVCQEHVRKNEDEVEVLYHHIRALTGKCNIRARACLITLPISTSEKSGFVLLCSRNPHLRHDPHTLIDAIEYKVSLQKLNKVTSLS